MLLHTENICPYLLHKGLIESETLVNGDLVITATPTRNNVFRVQSSGSRSLFVKQVSAFGNAETAILKREAEAYRFISETPGYEKLQQHIPAFIHYDAQQHILVTEYRPNTQSTHDHYLAQQVFPPALAAEQARILATVHKPAIPAGHTNPAFPQSIPWIMQLGDFGAYEFFPQHKINGELISIIQQHPGLQQMLSALKKEWVPSSLIHGDIKWVNFIITMQQPAQQYLVDWELADIGDPCWDTAGILQSYLSAWAFAFDNQQPALQQLGTAMQAFEPAKMQAAICSFWETYTRHMQTEPGKQQQLLLKTVNFCAARMIQTAIEGVVYHTSIQANNIRCIQIAHNILKNPLLAAEKLLGITSVKKEYA